MMMSRSLFPNNTKTTNGRQTRRVIIPSPLSQRSHQSSSLLWMLPRPTPTPQIRRARTRRPRCSQRLRASDSNHPIRFSDLIQHLPLVQSNKQSNFSGLFHPNLLEPRFGSRFRRRTCARLPHSLILIHAIRKSCSIQISLLGAATKVTSS